MKLVNRTLAGLCLSLALSFPIQASPWHFTPVGPFGTMDAGVDQLVYPGSDPRRLLVVAAGDLWESRDAGHSWRSVLANFPQIEAAALVTDPSDADRWYVTGPLAADSQIWQTADAGRTWSILQAPAAGEGERLLALFLDRFRPADLALEILRIPPGGGAVYQRFLSRDRGQTWTELVLDGLAGRHAMLGLNGGSLYLSDRRYELATGAVSAVTLGGRPFFDLERPDSLFIAEIDIHEADLFLSNDRGATKVPLVGIPHDFAFLVQSPADPDHLALGRAIAGISLSLDRGATWTEILPADWRIGVDPTAAFDPANGELIVASDRLERRRHDGSLEPLAQHGLLASTPVALATGADSAVTLDFAGRTAVRDHRGVFVPRGSLPDPGFSCISGWQAAILPDNPDYALMACRQVGIFVTRDGGDLWTAAPEPPRGDGAYRLLAMGSEFFLLSHGEIYRTTAFGIAWERIFVSPNGNSGFAVHPDPARGIVAVGGIGGVSVLEPGQPPQFNIAYLPGGGVAPGGGVPHSQNYPYLPFAHDPAHPDLLYAIHGEVLSRSLDFGRHWQEVSNLETALPQWEPLAPFFALLIDPFDPEHLLLPDYRVESRDGGRTFVPSPEVYWPVAFDRQVPGRMLVPSLGRGVLERSDELPACPDQEEAWCAGGGRYLLTVDWKDHQGQRGHGRRVQTGDQNSGLFHFFDENNWELLVKVLDGCAINQRQWVFAAGTTDVEYVLRVEDRWTGQIRHYANVAGQASPAITDSDAFAGCGVAPPSGARPTEPNATGAAGEPALELLGGRFEAKTRWTDFAGQEGDGLTVGLRTGNSGLFYFFDPSNWEMLVKVLDGCAINGHYWVLAAATTDVGFELTVEDLEGEASRTYRNRVGQAAPATIDLEAFACTP